MNDWKIFQSEYIVNNLPKILEDADLAHEQFKKLFPDEDSTWTYAKYNIFALTAPSPFWYQIYLELRNIVRNELGDTRPLWIQAWLNYHKENEVLDWHGHNFDYHGYISLDPKKTNTIFETYTIENKPGQIYFGPGWRLHKVEVLESYEGVRSTIGFDIQSIPEQSKFVNWIDRPFINMALIPLL